MKFKTKPVILVIVLVLIACFITAMYISYPVDRLQKVQDRQTDRLITETREARDRDLKPFDIQIDSIQDKILEMNSLLDDVKKQRQRRQESWDRKINQYKQNYSYGRIIELEQDCRAGQEDKCKNIPPSNSIIPSAEAADLPAPVITPEITKIEPEVKPEAKRPFKKDGSPEQQERIGYAWEISKNPEFIYTLEAENGRWTHDRKHTVPYQLCHSWKDINRPVNAKTNNCNDTAKYFWKTHYDWGFCGTSDGYKYDIYIDPKFMTDWKWQMDQCWDMFSKKVRMYGKDKIAKTKDNFYWE